MFVFQSLLAIVSADGRGDETEAPAMHSEPRRLRIGVRLRSARSLSFGVAPGSPQVDRGEAEQQKCIEPPSSRRVKRSKLEMAEAEIAELKGKLKEKRPGGRASTSSERSASECIHCKVIKESFQHGEALYRRQLKHMKGQYESSKEKAVELARQHEDDLKARDKDILIRQGKHDKKVEILEYKLDVAKVENNRVVKEAKENATKASIASKEASKELARTRALNEKLVAAATRDKIEIGELRDKIVELRDEISRLSSTLEDIEDEFPIQLSSDDEQPDESGDPGAPESAEEDTEEAEARYAHCTPHICSLAAPFSHFPRSPCTGVCVFGSTTTAIYLLDVKAGCLAD